MAGADQDDTPPAELLHGLERLRLRARAVAGGDEAQLIGLIDEIEKIRRELVRGRDRVVGELERAAARAVAITAYVRGARSGRSGRH